ncbi:MAG: hypothetical protein AB7P21_00255 [Lautropia sp.]
MNRLTTQDRVRILTVLSEGMGVNAACRVTGASKNTVLKLLAELMPCWLVGFRDFASTDAFIEDLAGRLANRVQLTTDGFGAYPAAVERHFGADVDYVQR